MTHNNHVVIESAALLARITLEALKGTSPLDALQKLLSDEPEDYILSPLIEAGLKSKGQDTRQTILGFGQMCEAGSALPSVIHLLATYENDIKNALIENVMAGGDSAARGMIVGMVLGAYHGENAGIPDDIINFNFYFVIDSSRDLRINIHLPCSAYNIEIVYIFPCFVGISYLVGRTFINSNSVFINIFFIKYVNNVIRVDQI